MTFRPFNKLSIYSLVTTGIYALLCGISVSVILLPEESHAVNSQSFEIDLKELKSRSISNPQVPNTSIEKSSKSATTTKTVRKKKHKTRKQIRKTVSDKTSPTVPARQIFEDQQKISLLKTLPSPDSVPVQTSDLTLILKSSDNSCKLTQQLLKSRLSTPLTPSEVLATLPQISFHSVRGGKTKAVITCDLSSKEQLTYGRLLSIHDIKIINISKDDSPEKTVNKITASLGYATQSFRTTNNSRKVIYVYPDGNEKGIFILIP